MTQELAHEWIKGICTAEAWPRFCTDPANGGAVLWNRYVTTPHFSIRALRLTANNHSGHAQSDFYLSLNGELLHVTTHHSSGAVCVSRYPQDMPWSDETINAILPALKKLDDILT